MYARCVDHPASERDLIAQFVANQNLPCPHCGYNLRSLATGADVPRCPECGLKLTLRIIQKAGHWRARSVRRIVATFLSVGFFALYIVVDVQWLGGPTILPLLVPPVLTLSASSLLQEAWALRTRRMASPGMCLQSWMTVCFICGGVVVEMTC